MGEKLLGPNEIEEFSVAVPGNRDALLGQYEAVVGHARDYCVLVGASTIQGVS